MSNYSNIAAMMAGKHKEQKDDSVVNSAKDANMNDLAWQYFNMVLRCNPSSYSIANLTNSLAVPEFGLHCYMTTGALIDKCLRDDCLVYVTFFERLRETLDKLNGSLSSAITFKYIYRSKQGNIPKQFDVIFGNINKACNFLDVILRRKTSSDSDINRYAYVMLHNSILFDMTDSIYYGPAQKYTPEGMKNGIYIKTSLINDYRPVCYIDNSTELSVDVCDSILLQARRFVGMDSTLSAGVKIGLKLVLDSYDGDVYSTEFKFSNISKLEGWLDNVSKMIESGNV